MDMLFDKIPAEMREITQAQLIQWRDQYAAYWGAPSENHAEIRLPRPRLPRLRLHGRLRLRGRFRLRAHGDTVVTLRCRNGGEEGAEWWKKGDVSDYPPRPADSFPDVFLMFDNRIDLDYYGRVCWLRPFVAELRTVSR